jgi:hypothetical protein
MHEPILLRRLIFVIIQPTVALWSSVLRKLGEISRSSEMRVLSGGGVGQNVLLWHFIDGLSVAVCLSVCLFVCHLSICPSINQSVTASVV